MIYTYPQVQGGYRWNMVQRIKQEVGLEPICTSDVSRGEELKTVIEFDRELTEQEKSTLDTVMANSPTLPPSGTCRAKIVDIYEKIAQFNAATGANIKIYYSEGTTNSGVIDIIELHTANPLTNTQKTKIQTAYGNLLTVL